MAQDGRGRRLVRCEIVRPAEHFSAEVVRDRCDLVALGAHDDAVD
jgi:hypothetical protein